MKLIIFSLASICSVLFCSDIQAIRKDFHMIKTEENLEKFISDYTESECTEAQPYLAAAIMRQAEFCFWPGSKLNYFSQGKAMLENYISQDETDIEARYVRALVQSQLPSFLGYNSQCISDCEYVQAHLLESDIDKEYQETILKEIKHLLNTK